MTAHQHPSIVCDHDGCLAQYPEEMAGELLDCSPREVRRVAKEEGWLHTLDGGDFCPDHRPRRKR